MWPHFVRAFVTEGSNLTDSQLIGAALDWTKLVKHGDTVFSIRRWSVPLAEQRFIPAHPHTHTFKMTIKRE